MTKRKKVTESATKVDVTTEVANVATTEIETVEVETVETEPTTELTTTTATTGTTATTETAEAVLESALKSWAKVVSKEHTSFASVVRDMLSSGDVVSKAIASVFGLTDATAKSIKEFRNSVFAYYPVKDGVTGTLVTYKRFTAKVRTFVDAKATDGVFVANTNYIDIIKRAYIAKVLNREVVYVNMTTETTTEDGDLVLDFMAYHINGIPFATDKQPVLAAQYVAYKEAVTAANGVATEAKKQSLKEAATAYKEAAK
jgi:hypothetical protein